MKKIIKWIVVGLIAEYVLGMYAAMLAVPPGDPGYAAEPFYSKLAIPVHSLLGLILLILAVILFVLGFKNKNQAYKKMTIYGFLSITIAFAAGIATVALKENASEIASFIMSFGFLLSFILYGRLFFLLKK